jgi:hypothetical protein
MPCQCCKCGFLAVYQRNTEEYFAANDELRETGTSNAYTICVGGKFQVAIGALPEVCLENAADLQREIRDLEPNLNNKLCAAADSVKAVIQKDRECPKFFPYQRGATPKEHRDMKLSEEFRRINQEWRDKAQRDQSDSERRAEEIAERRHGETLAEARKYRIPTIILAAVALIVSVLSAIVSAVLSFRH